MLIPAKFWSIDHWVKFNIIPDEYENLIAFLNAHGLSFLTLLELNFDNIPTSLHGSGRSKNLNEYAANNTGNVSLLLRFFNYFMFDIINMRYLSGKNINFHFSESDTWQTMGMEIYGPYIPVTTTALPTTTSLPMEWFFPEL